MSRLVLPGGPSGSWGAGFIRQSGVLIMLSYTAFFYKVALILPFMNNSILDYLEIEKLMEFAYVMEFPCYQIKNRVFVGKLRFVTESIDCIKQN